MTPARDRTSLVIQTPFSIQHALCRRRDQFTFYLSRNEYGCYFEKRCKFAEVWCLKLSFEVKKITYNHPTSQRIWEFTFRASALYYIFNIAVMCRTKIQCFLNRIIFCFIVLWKTVAHKVEWVIFCFIVLWKTVVHRFSTSTVLLLDFSNSTVKHGRRHFRSGAWGHVACNLTLD